MHSTCNGQHKGSVQLLRLSRQKLGNKFMENHISKFNEFKESDENVFLAHKQEVVPYRTL